MNRVRHKWLATVVKTHFASREAHPLGVSFWACELYLSLFWLLTDPLGVLLGKFKLCFHLRGCAPLLKHRGNY
jgi:hypothetical protein